MSSTYDNINDAASAASSDLEPSVVTNEDEPLYERLPYHAIETGSKAPNQNNLVGSTYVFQRLCEDFTAKLSGNALESFFEGLVDVLKVGGHDIQTVDELCFVKKIVHLNDKSATSAIYRHGDRFYKRIAATKEERVTLVRRIILSRRKRLERAGGASASSTKQSGAKPTSSPTKNGPLQELSPLPDHAIEPSSKSGRRNNPIGATSVLRALRGDFRGALSDDELKEFLEILVEVLQHIGFAVATVNDICFVRKIDAVNEEGSSTTMIYRDCNFVYERIATTEEDRLLLLKAYFKQKQYKSQQNRASYLLPRDIVDVPASVEQSLVESPLQGMSFQEESPPAPLPPSHWSIQTFLSLMRTRFNEHCARNVTRDEYDVFTRRIMQVLLTSAEEAVGDLHEEEVNQKIMNLVNGFWNMYFEGAALDGNGGDDDDDDGGGFNGVDDGGGGYDGNDYDGGDDYDGGCGYDGGAGGDDAGGDDGGGGDDAGGDNGGGGDDGGGYSDYYDSDDHHFEGDDVDDGEEDSESYDEGADDSNDSEGIGNEEYASKNYTNLANVTRFMEKIRAIRCNLCDGNEKRWGMNAMIKKISLLERQNSFKRTQGISNHVVNGVANELDQLDKVKQHNVIDLSEVVLGQLDEILEYLKDESHCVPLLPLDPDSSTCNTCLADCDSSYRSGISDSGIGKCCMPETIIDKNKDQAKDSEPIKFEDIQYRCSELSDTSICITDKRDYKNPSGDENKQTILRTYALGLNDKSLPPLKNGIEEQQNGHGVLELPWHAIELGAFAGSQHNALHGTLILRRVRGLRRNPSDDDLYTNVYGQLLQGMAQHKGAPKSPEDLVFVRKWVGTPLKNPTSIVYRRCDIYYEQISIQDRDKVVKQYINQKTYTPKAKTAPSVPLCLRSCVLLRRYEFEQYCQEQSITDFSRNEATNNFHALLTCAEAAVEDLKDQNVVRDLMNLINKYWDSLVTSPTQKASNSICNVKNGDDKERKEQLGPGSSASISGPSWFTCSSSPSGEQKRRMKEICSDREGFEGQSSCKRQRLDNSSKEESLGLYTRHFDNRTPSNYNGAPFADFESRLMPAAENEILEELEKCFQQNANVNAQGTKKGLCWSQKSAPPQAYFENRLRSAMDNGNLRAVEKCLHRSGNENTGMTPLHSACVRGLLEEVQYLVRDGNANFNAKSNDGWTALHFAIDKGHLKIVQCLVRDVEVDVEATTSTGWTALRLACDRGLVEVVQCLVRDGKVDLEAKTTTGWTALHLACYKGHVEVVRCLIRDGKANVEAKSNNGWTALHLARCRGHVEVVQFLLGMPKRTYS
jgi:Ankyrin repeats (3 copies)